MNENGSQTFVKKIKEKLHTIPKRKLRLWSVSGVIVILIAVGSVFVIYGTYSKEEKTAQAGQMFGSGGNLGVGEIVTASGTTALGYTMDEFEPDYIETEIYIEEVYLSSGDEVEEGTPVFKVSEENIAEARAELEEKKEETSLAYRAGLITYEQSKINAKYTLDAAVMEGQQAEAVYQSAVKDAEEKLQRAKDAVTETEEKIEEYGNAYADYYYEYHIDTYKEKAEKNNEDYHTFLAEFGFSESDLNGSGQGASASSSDSGSQDKNEVPKGSKEETSGGTEGEKEETSGEAEEDKEESSGGTEGSKEETSGETGESKEEASGEAEEGKEETSGETGESKEDISGEAEEEKEEISEEAEEDKEEASGESKEDISGEAESKEDTSAVETEALLLSLFTDRNTTLSRLTSGVSLGDGVSFMSVSSSKNDNEEYTRRLAIVQQMKKNKEESQSYLDKAWDEYKAAAEKADAELKKLKVQVESLRAELTEAETTYQLEVLEAETAYKKSLAQSELAQSDYDAAIQKAEDDLESLKDEKTEAEENLAEFETLLGDGVFYTHNAGTVMMVGARSESNLQGGSMVVAYRNSEDISVTVSVSQEDINKLEVGDTAQVMVEDYGTFEGQITYLNPVSNSESRTNITYEVIVDLNGENINSLTENLTATVIFQTGDSSQ